MVRRISQTLEAKAVLRALAETRTRAWLD